MGLSLDVVAGPAEGLGPVTVRRGDGVAHVMYGSPAEPPHLFSTVARYGDEYSYEYDGAPDHLRLGLTECVAPGDAVVVSLPWQGAEAYPYVDWWVDERNVAPEVASLDELRSHAGPAYLVEDGRLWLKLSVRGGHEWAYLDVCTAPLCGS